MREIPLPRGLCALVDDADFDSLAQHKWTVVKPKRAGFYVLRFVPPRAVQKTVYMHRAILGLTDRWQFADHINGNGLDNRRCNLRVATPSQNSMSMRTDNEYRGVFKVKNRWLAAIQFEGQKLRLGRFDTPQEAAHAYDNTAIRLFGEFARLNFPQELARAA